jgi:hypothetical protein
MDQTDNRVKQLRTFLDHHHLASSELLTQRQEMIYVFLDAQESVETSINTHAQRLAYENEPTWALLLTMLGRVGEQVQGTIVTYLTGVWASTEAIARVAIESAANFIYIVDTDRVHRLGSFLTDYFDASAKRQTMHRKVLESNLPETEAELEQMENAESQLFERRQAMQAVCDGAGIPFPVTGWPKNVLQRFQGINEERAYRSIYTVLSSQTHNDAESLVDYVIVKCLADNDQKMRVVGAELNMWLCNYVATAIEWYLRGCKTFGRALGMNELVDTIEHLQKRLSELADADLGAFNGEVAKAIENLASG